jgi:hypothetical protein
VASQMRADIKKARAILEHPVIKGASFEEVFRCFLREYLPNSLNVSTGIIVDSKGNSSRQLDVIISDALKTPIFFKSENIRVIPVECVYAIVEVKAYLNSIELKRTFENMQSVRNLKKIAFIKPNVTDIIKRTCNLYGQEWEIWPISYFIFAFDSDELPKLSALLNKIHESASAPEWSRIDTICVLDKGVICNYSLSEEKFDALPSPNSKLYVCRTKDALLLFYSLISKYIFQTWLPPFRFTPYLGQMTFNCMPESK